MAVSVLNPASKSRALEITCVNDSVDKFSLLITSLRKGLKVSLRPIMNMSRRGRSSTAVGKLHLNNRLFSKVVL